MKHLLLTTFVALSLLMLSNQSSYAQYTKEYSLQSFDGISASAVFDIEVVKAPYSKVILSADTNRDITENVSVNIRKGVLILEYKIPRRMFSNSNSAKKITAKVYMNSELSKLDLCGATLFSSNERFTPKNFRGDFSGATRIAKLIIETPGTIKLDVSGACKMELQGEANHAEYEFSGASKIHLNQVVNSCDIDISGASVIKIEGSAKRAEIEASGASKLNAEYFMVDNLDVELTGASKGSVYVMNKMTVEITGASFLKYKGNPQIIGSTRRVSKL